MSPDLADLIPSTIDLGVLPSELDEGIASRAAIGLVVLTTDQTMEHEFRALLRLPGVAVYKSRRDPARHLARHWAKDRAERRAHPAGDSARRRRLRLHVGDDDPWRRGGVRRNPQIPPGRRLHDPGHRRACRLSHVWREVH